MDVYLHFCLLFLVDLLIVFFLFGCKLNIQFDKVSGLKSMVCNEKIQEQTKMTIEAKDTPKATFSTLVKYIQSE